VSELYILRDGEPVVTDNLREWGEFYQNNDNRRVAWTEHGGVRVSTVFLGLDHGWNGTPLLFETMVFGGELNEETDRYSTLEEAQAGHEAMCRRVWPEVQP
jgi:hypothetical protein